MGPRRRRVRAACGTVAAALVLTACGNPLGSEDDSDQVTAPRNGLCRDLTVADLAEPSNASAVVPCSARHTAQTFLVGTLPASTGSSYDDKRHGRYVFDTCQKAFGGFLGADESMVLRSQLSWAWFRPSERGWDRDARWFRCDVVGGPAEARELRALPDNAQGLFAADLPDEWLTCATGPTVTGGPKVPCSEKHDWRAVTSVVLGKPADPYPGDRIVEVRSRDYCRDSVGGWLGYPPDYEYGYTWFRGDRWEGGNRRAICWARTDQ